MAMSNMFSTDSREIPFAIALWTPHTLFAGVLFSLRSLAGLSDGSTQASYR